MSLPSQSKRATAYDSFEGRLPADLHIGEMIGSGRRCEVFAARWRGLDLIPKRYRRAAVTKHRSLAETALAEFEYRRNHDWFAVPRLEGHVARPIGYHIGDTMQVMVQERVAGPLCCDAGSAWSEIEWGVVRDRLIELVTFAHGAGIYDLDLHPRNVILAPRTDCRNRSCSTSTKSRSPSGADRH